MSKKHVLTEHDFPTARVEAIALVDKQTQFVDGLPYDGFGTALVISHHSKDGSTEGQLVLTLGEDDFFNLANALAAAGYKIREARLRASKGRAAQKPE
jgi:hypothetical protein